MLKKIKQIIKSKQNTWNNKRDQLSKKITYKIETTIYIKWSKNFDKKWYLKTYPEVKQSPLKPHIHYYERGWKEGKHPSIYFDYKQYFKNNPDIETSGLCPLFHYEKYGKKEGREKNYIDPQYDENYREYKISRYLKRNLGKILYHKQIIKNKNVKILVYIHIFYIKSIKEIKEYLKNLEPYSYDLIVTCTKGVYEKEITDIIKKIKENATIIPCQNRGYDIGPFFEILNKVNLNNYDILFKLQSKGTFHRTSYIYGQIFKDRDWFSYLYEGIIGPFTVHKTINLLNNKNNKIGIVAAKNLIITDPIHKKNFTKKQLAKKQLTIPNNYQFIAGTCYAQKAKTLKELQKLKLTIKDFEPSEKGYFSFAHAMERYMTSYIFKKNYQIYGNNICKLRRLKYHHIEKKLETLSGIRLLNDKRFELSDDFILRTAECSLIKKYEIDKIKLGKITRLHEGIYYPLTDCSPYKYLLGEKERYLNYCTTLRRSDYMDKSEKEYQQLAKKEYEQKYQSLINELNKNSYNSYNPIVIDGNTNSVLDGLHRACYLLYKYGENYEIEVLKIYPSMINIQHIKPLFNKLK